MSGKNVLLGLGIGLVCSGMVLLFVNGRSSSGISDNEIKKRAEQLGMVEKEEDAILTSEIKNIEMDQELESDFDHTVSENDISTNGVSTKNISENDALTQEENKKEEENNKDSSSDTADDKGNAKTSEKIEQNNNPENIKNVSKTQITKKNSVKENKNQTQAVDNADQKNTENTTDKKSQKKKQNESKNKSKNTQKVDNKEKNSNNNSNKKNTKEEKSDNLDTSENIIKVEIKSGMTAQEICQELENEKLIEDAEKFKQYLISKGIQHKLRAGTYQIEDGSDYETIVDHIYKG